MPPAATAPPATPRCTRWAPSCVTATRRRRNSICPRSPAASCACRPSARHRADLGHRYSGAAYHGAARRQRPLCRQRPEDMDLARRAFDYDAAARSHDAARAGQETYRRALGVHRRHASGRDRQHDDHTDPHHDEYTPPRRSSSTTCVVPAENLIGEEDRASATSSPHEWPSAF